RTPERQPNTVTSATPVLFQATYTFADANTNGISDAWEQQVFGGVSPDRTRATDTDGDGMTDYAEFIAGTDPKNTNSVLELMPPASQPNDRLRFEWASVPGRPYRLAASRVLVNWTPFSDWVP